MIVRPFRLADLDFYRGRTVEMGIGQWFSIAEVLENQYSRTVEIDGVPVGSGGLTDIGHGSAFAWAVLTDISRGALSVHRATAEGLKQGAFNRIEAHVELSLERSHRWVRLLGFRMDHDRPTLFAQGRLFVRYVK